jgi:hypothetical protein
MEVLFLAPRAMPEFNEDYTEIVNFIDKWRGPFDHRADTRKMTGQSCL